MQNLTDNLKKIVIKGYVVSLAESYARDCLLCKDTDIKCYFVLHAEILPLIKEKFNGKLRFCDRCVGSLESNFDEMVYRYQMGLL